MTAKIIQTIIILAVLIAGFLAIYLQKPFSQQEKKQPEEIKAIIKTSPIPTISLPIDTMNESLFGILGEGRGSDFTNSQMNTEILNQLFDQMKQKEVQAVFFTGNIVSGLEKGNGQPKPIDSKKLQNELKDFSKLYQDVFKEEIPLFPVLGDRETEIPGSAKEFIETFHLQGAQAFGGELLYTVSAGHAFFAIIATDALVDGSTKVGVSFSDSVLKWLDFVLKGGAKTHRYLFVLGYEPAFPSTTTFLKERRPERDEFWKILIQNNVLAYFSSKEHLFDRSNRHGVWQIISGGGGAPTRHGRGTPFHHALILTIPGDRKPFEKERKIQDPQVQVIDNKGNIVEEFTLGQENQPLYQMRIS